MKEKVCICIPHFNNGKTIAKTLDSLLKQTYSNIIIKVIDNMSTDNSMEILTYYRETNKNIIVIQNETNIGAEANFTECIRHLEGDFGAIYHADDLYHPTIVEAQVKYLMEYDISAVFVRANLIDDDSNHIGEQFFPDELKGKDYHQFDFEQLFSLILKYDNFLITPSVMVKIDIYKNKIQSWNGDKFKTSADLDVWLRLSEIKDIGIITDKLISYRMSTASFSYRTKFKRVEPRDMFIVIDYYLNKYKHYNFDNGDYEYLKFKDNVLVVSNKILNTNFLNSSELKLLNFQIFSKILIDSRKLKIYIYAVLLKIGLYLKCKNLILKLVKSVNNIPESIKF